MNQNEQSHNYLVIGVAALLAIILLGPYFGFHLFGTKPETPLPQRSDKRPQLQQPIRPSSKAGVVRPKKKRNSGNKVSTRTKQRNNESLSDIEDLLK